jgi:hypothetical protein
LAALRGGLFLFEPHAGLMIVQEFDAASLKRALHKRQRASTRPDLSGE